MKNIETAKKYQDYMVEKRRYFHENRELTGQEYKTIEYLSSELTNLGIDAEKGDNPECGSWREFSCGMLYSLVLCTKLPSVL